MAAAVARLSSRRQNRSSASGCARNLVGTGWPSSCSQQDIGQPDPDLAPPVGDLAGELLERTADRLGPAGRATLVLLPGYRSRWPLTETSISTQRWWASVLSASSANCMTTGRTRPSASGTKATCGW